MFTAITCADQVAPFAGHFVAYETESCYFGTHPDGRTGYTVDPHSRTRYGYVEPDNFSYGEKGYNLSRFLFAKDVPSNCALIHSIFLRYGPVLMRLAAVEELSALKVAINTDAATLEYKSIFESKAQILKLIDDEISMRELS